MIPSLIVPLCNPVSSVRKSAIACVKTLNSKLPQGFQAVTITALVRVLTENAEELATDPEQLPKVFGDFFKPLLPHDKPRPKDSAEIRGAKNTLKYLLQHLVSSDMPSYVRRIILSSLRKVDTQVGIWLAFIQYMTKFSQIWVKRKAGDYT